MFFEDRSRRSDRRKKRPRSGRTAERPVAHYCSIRATMREVNRRLALDEEFDSVTPMNG